MNDLLFERTSSGASTCIIVGNAHGAPIPDLARFRRVLWIVDRAGATCGLPGTNGNGSLVIEVLETLPDASAAPAIGRFMLHDARHVPHVCVTSGVIRQHAAAFEKVVAEVQAIIETEHRARAARTAEGFSRQKNFFLNLPDLVRQRVPATWSGTLGGLPAFVCGAGASLEVSAAALARVADEGVIIAQDAALPVLARFGVQADFAVSIDPSVLPKQVIEGGIEPARVILSGCSAPAWRAAEATYRLFYLQSRSPTEDWLASNGMPRSEAPIADSPASVALNLARFLGCGPVYLFGMDFCDTLSSGASHASSRLPHLTRSTGESVPATMWTEWREFDARLAAWPEGSITNVTDRGVWMRGAQLVRPDALSIPATPLRKRRALSHLTPADAVICDATRACLAELGAIGAHGCRETEDLRRALRTGGPESIAARLRTLFADEALAYALGTFALKVRPLLASPIEGDRATWSALLDEFEELCCLAEAVYDLRPA